MKRVKSLYFLPLLFLASVPAGYSLHLSSLKSHLSLALTHALSGRTHLEVLERSQALLRSSSHLEAAVSIVCRGEESLSSLPAWINQRFRGACSGSTLGWREFMVSGDLTGTGERLLAIGEIGIFAIPALLIAFGFTFFLGFAALLVELRMRDAALIRQTIEETGRIIGVTGDTSGMDRDSSIFTSDLEERANQLRSRLESVQAQRISDASKARVGEIALQVAHDIRSPLTVLDFLADEMEGLSAGHRNLFRSSIERVRNIASDLMRLGRRGTPLPSGEASGQAQSIPLLVGEVVEEKQFLAQKFSSLKIVFDPACYLQGLFAHVEPWEFRRVISNILDNAMEAIETGTISIRVYLGLKKVLIDIEDDGPGFSLSSSRSLGLGLAHAAKTVTGLHGRLSIEPQEGKRGSRARVSLPIAQQPPWFAHEILVPPMAEVVAFGPEAPWVDRIQRLAKERGAGERFSILRTWSDYSPDKGQVLLVDETYVDVLAGYLDSRSLGPRGYLITHGISERVIGFADQLGLRLIPSAIMPWIPLRYKAAARPPVLGASSPPVADL